MLAVYSVSIFFVDSWAAMVVFAAEFVVCVAYQKSIGMPISRIFKISIPVYAIAAITVICNIFVWNGESVTFELSGLMRGCFFAARLLLLVWASMAVCLSFDMASIERAFASLISPLRRFKVPVDDIATALSIALRFIPLVFDRYFEIRRAQWARGAQFDEGSIHARIKANVAIFAPLVISLFRSTDRLAMAMDARCYGALGVPRTNIHEHHPKTSELACLIALSILCIACCVML